FINSRDKACLVSTDNIISFDEIYSASLVTFKILESIRTGKPMTVL
ncbi:MAG: hypothetical protein JJW03_02590, partial [Desulfosarcina sp.]|nr:hypothetical protein [Desulfobacterales bacterium]